MSSFNQAHVVTSAITPIGSVVSVAAVDGVDPSMPNFTASIRYYSNAVGGVITPGAGTVTVTATGLASGQNTTITDGTLNSTDITDYVDWKLHCTAVTATPVGVTTATHYQLVVIQG